MAWEVEQIDVTPFKAIGKCTLLHTPIKPTEVCVDPDGGPAQMYGRDFVVSGNELSWNIPASDIKGVLADGYSVSLRVQYERS